MSGARIRYEAVRYCIMAHPDLGHCLRTRGLTLQFFGLAGRRSLGRTGAPHGWRRRNTERRSCPDHPTGHQGQDIAQKEASIASIERPPTASSQGRALRFSGSARRAFRQGLDRRLLDWASARQPLPSRGSLCCRRETGGNSCRSQHFAASNFSWRREMIRMFNTRLDRHAVSIRKSRHSTP